MIQFNCENVMKSDHLRCLRFALHYKCHDNKNINVVDTYILTAAGPSTPHTKKILTIEQPNTPFFGNLFKWQ